MKYGQRYAFLLFVYSFFTIFMVNMLTTTQKDFRLYHEKIENSSIDCTQIYQSGPRAKKYKMWKVNTDYIQHQLEEQDDVCSTLHKYFIFPSAPSSTEEIEFPLAFGFLVHTDVIQVLFTLSLLYQPQNRYCLTIDNRSDEKFKNVLMKVPRCFENIRVQIGDMSEPYQNKMGVLNNVYQCLTDLTVSSSNWKYYQFVAAHDVPLKTNLEMVRILQALNGSINTEIRQYANWRYGIRRSDTPPLTLYQGGMGVALPRAAADHIVLKKNVDELLNYLSKTHLPYETFWATIAGNKGDFDVPGSIRGSDLIRLQQPFKSSSIDWWAQSPETVATTYVARLEVSHTKPWCGGVPWCDYGLEDIPFLLTRPQLMAHKIHMKFQNAAYICLAKELRRRTVFPEDFDATNYSFMPTVELHGGMKVEELTHRNWTAVGWIYEKFS